MIRSRISPRSRSSALRSVLSSISSAQLVADREQQLALGVQHVVQSRGHRVDLFGQVAELVAVARHDGLGEVALAVAHGAFAQRRQRAQHVAHPGVGHPGEQQQDGQRGPADMLGALFVRHVGQAEDDAVAIGHAAHDAPVARVELLQVARNDARARRGARRPRLTVGVDAGRTRRPRHDQRNRIAVGQRDDAAMRRRAHALRRRRRRWLVG
jgi:hypothetical protein